ncbi:hypothetical protein GH714_018651 [Hevea brasiliensis]|uniref:Leucine-rich repeat-containing N-terminal plant-type domain-containing protein n=1 Tax=Hevea brasiliensis TaxID=3981 RepID=A0A6A6N2W6_HEVBR|nr:hypothetical protein GH714_018651 [Hevea brasiliensis]
MLKDGFHVSLDRFSSWVPEEDCCKWKGVGCNNETGHVITLDLHSPDPSELLQGELRDSLVHLPYLSYLDLSLNDFCQTQIPEFIGSLSNLKYLNLPRANFRGNIPCHLGNLSSLQTLDLSNNQFSLGLAALTGVRTQSMVPSLVELRLFSCQLHNLPQSLPSLNFSCLEVLDLSYNGFYHSLIPNWLVEVSHTLRVLNFRTCWLQHSIAHAIVNFTSLAVLDLSYNSLTGSFPQYFGNLTSLYVLDFSHNNLMDSIPHDFGNMTSLVVLDLSFNDLEGPLPATLGHHFKHSPLRELYLSDNFLTQLSLEKILPQLSELVVLDVAGNYLNGVITEAHLQNFTRLKLVWRDTSILAELHKFGCPGSWEKCTIWEHTDMAGGKFQESAGDFVASQCFGRKYTSAALPIETLKLPGLLFQFIIRTNSTLHT